MHTETDDRRKDTSMETPHKQAVCPHLCLKIKNPIASLQAMSSILCRKAGKWHAQEASVHI